MLTNGKALEAAIESGKPEPTNAAQAAELAKVPDFCDMTADEIKDYDGPVYWAKCTCLAPDRISLVSMDFESTTGKALAAKLSKQRGLTIHDVGVRNDDLLAACKEAERVIRWAAQESSGRVDREIVGGWIHHANKIAQCVSRAEGRQG